MKITLIVLAIAFLITCQLTPVSLAAQGAEKPMIELPTGSITGVVSIIGSQGKSTPLPKIPLTLTCESTDSQNLTTVTDSAGRYQFANLSGGTCSIKTAADKFKPTIKTVVLQDGEERIENIVLELTNLSFEVEVQDEVSTLLVESSRPDTALAGDRIPDLPMADQKFQEALHIVPGVIQTLDGKVNIKGESESQGMLLVDSAQMVDPVTGSLTINIPLSAIQSMNVHKTPYNSEYGSFSGGLTTIETKPPLDHWDYGLGDFLPGVRGRSGHLVGLSVETPHAFLSGPILHDKLNFSESFDYVLRKRPVRGLAWPNNEVKTQGFNSFTSFQAILSPQHFLTGNIDIFPMRTQFANISSLVPQSASSNYNQKGASVGISDNNQISSGVLLTTAFRYTRFRGNGYGQGPDDMLITPDGWKGNYFNSWTRTADQYEISPVFQLSPQPWYGKHHLKTGLDFTYRSYDGNVQSNPVRLLNENGTLAQRIDFQGPGLLSGHDREISEFLHDNWSLSDNLTLDLGLRFTNQSNGRSAAFAPRAGVAYSPDRSHKMVIRAGGGLFYDRIPLLAVTFRQMPERVISSFDNSGTMIGQPIVYRNLYWQEGADITAGGRQTLGTSPRNLTWSFELERDLVQNVKVGVSYLQSHTQDLFIVNPLSGAPGQNSVLALSHAGNSHYHEFEAKASIRWGRRNDLNLSYTRSRARGDLNTFSGVFTQFEQPVIRANAGTTYTNADVPNRFLASGLFMMPWHVTFSPVLDIHNGLRYSNVNVLQEYVGQPNSQRFPNFFSFDVRIYREFNIPFNIGFLKGRRFRLGYYALNVTNHLNPQDIYNNTASPFFGQFAGYRHRVNGAVIDIVR